MHYCKKKIYYKIIPKVFKVIKSKLRSVQGEFTAISYIEQDISVMTCSCLGHIRQEFSSFGITTFSLVVKCCKSYNHIN